MTWLRLDDGFDQHPKFAGWSVDNRWSWLQVMLYCARFQTKGRLPNDLSLMPRTVTKRLLKKAVESGWLDPQEDGTLVIHDWAVYNPSPDAERMRLRRQAERMANAEANDSRTEDRTNGRTDTARKTNPRGRASAPVPGPSPKNPPPFPSEKEGEGSTTNAFAAPASAKVAHACRAWLDGHGFDRETMTVETAADEFGVIERRMHAELTLADRDELLALAATLTEHKDFVGDEP